MFSCLSLETADASTTPRILHCNPSSRTHKLKNATGRYIDGGSASGGLPRYMLDVEIRIGTFYMYVYTYEVHIVAW